MSRRAFVLQEMGHSPLWLQRETVPAPLTPPAVTIEHSPPSPLQADLAPALPARPLQPDTAPPVPAVAASLPPAGDWQALQHEIADCQRCSLAQTRQQVVVGRGSHQARLLIIGEAPGEQEDRQGLPFVGKAGQLLENMLAAAGIDSAQDSYICNVIKCRPPGNRNPTPDEISHCQGFLQWQISNLQPTLIVALGRFAAHTLLQSQAPISSLRGKMHHAYGKPLLVTFHPAYLLRSPAEKAKAWQDWALVARTLSRS